MYSTPTCEKSYYVGSIWTIEGFDFIAILDQKPSSG